jgi:hypothetical protein
MKTGKILLLATLVLAVYLLHQDFWNWRTAEPLIFGVLPLGLAYHAGYSILASITMAILVRCAWPKHLEHVQAQSPAAQKEEGKPRA